MGLAGKRIREAIEATGFARLGPDSKIEMLVVVVERLVYLPGFFVPSEPRQTLTCSTFSPARRSEGAFTMPLEVGRGKMDLPGNWLNSDAGPLSGGVATDMEAAAYSNRTVWKIDCFTPPRPVGPDRHEAFAASRPQEY